MKPFVFLFIIMGVASLGMSRGNKISKDSVEITITTDACLKQYTDSNRITIKITNVTQQDFWVNAWALESIGLLETEDRVVAQKVKIEENSPSFPQFTLLQKNSSYSLTIIRDFYREYLLKAGELYTMQCIYVNHQKKKHKLPTLTGEISSNALKIRLCE